MLNGQISVLAIAVGAVGAVTAINVECKVFSFAASFRCVFKTKQKIAHGSWFHSNRKMHENAHRCL